MRGVAARSGPERVAIPLSHHVASEEQLRLVGIVRTAAELDVSTVAVPRAAKGYRC